MSDEMIDEDFPQRPKQKSGQPRLKGCPLFF